MNLRVKEKGVEIDKSDFEILSRGQQLKLILNLIVHKVLSDEKHNNLI